MLKKSCTDLKYVDMLNDFASRVDKWYMLPSKDIRQHGKLMRLVGGDKRFWEEIRHDKFVIDGVHYSYRCPVCRGSGQSGTQPCASCKGAGVRGDITKMKQRRQYLYNKLMRFQLLNSLKHDYLGTLYLKGITSTF